MATQGKNPVVKRRRSSLPNVKLLPLTMAERRALARQKRKEQEEAEKLKKAQEAELKKQRAKALRNASKQKDVSRRHKRLGTIMGNLIHCRFCDQMIDQMEFDEHKVSHPTHIRQRIWLGNAENSKDIAFVKKYGITHILNCTREISLPSNIEKQLKAFKRISIQDKEHETILDYINESNGFIDKALADSNSNVVFIHCREGRSRSVSFLCCYLMWKDKMSFMNALSDIRSKRHIVLPNNKFYRELEKFDKQIIIDREENECQKFGVASKKFKLMKVKKMENKRLSELQCLIADEVKDGDSENDDKKLDEAPKKMKMKRSNSVTSPREKKGKKKESDPWNTANGDIVENEKKKKKKKAKKKKKKKKEETDDLKIEEPVDVTDIFPPTEPVVEENGKKKAKKKKKKKSKN